MVINLAKRRNILLWQFLFLLLGTSWLWAPHLNTLLSFKLSLISQYETPGQPYSWLFRAGDVLASSLLLFAAVTYIKTAGKKTAGWLLFIVAVGSLLDPLLSTTCHVQGNTCREYVSFGFVLHAIETVVTSLALFAISAYDAWLRKKLVSIFFTILQLLYGLLFISQLANQDHFNTLSQLAYQAGVIVWLAWFCRDFLISDSFAPRTGELRLVKIGASIWAFVNGILAILISLAHIHLFGKINAIYFAGNSAWLAQHGVIIGVVMLYLSRHLARGEMRARQIFLAITAIEALKYAAVSPNAALLLLYSLTFSILFVFRDDFDRGTIPITWSVRLRDLYVMLFGLLTAIAASLLALDRDSRASTITSRALDNFSDYVARSTVIPRSHLRSALLADTISVFFAVSLASILWILFRPYKTGHLSGENQAELKNILTSRSNSSEDYFKLWPADKQIFWQVGHQGFIAYKVVGGTVFALADPLSAQPHELLTEFMTWSKSCRLRACFLPVAQKSTGLYKEAGLETIQIGSSAVINTETFLSETSRDKWWRWQKNRAQKSHYAYNQSRAPHSEALIQQFKTVSDTWLDNGERKERGFALGYFDTGYLNQCVVHYLRDDTGAILAFANELPQFKKSKTSTVDLLRYLPDARNAMPYLLSKIIEAAAEEEYQYFDLGFVPFAQAEGSLLAIARTMSAGSFSARGLEQFKNKFKPDWQPNYLAYDGDLADLALIALNLEKAMSLK